MKAIRIVYVFAAIFSGSLALGYNSSEAMAAPVICYECFIGADGNAYCNCCPV